MAQAFGVASEVASRWFSPPRNASHDLEHNLRRPSLCVDRERHVPAPYRRLGSLHRPSRMTSKLALFERLDEFFATVIAEFTD